MPRCLRIGLGALTLFLSPHLIQAQSPIEITVKREQIKELLPPFLHALKPEIEAQLREQMLNLDQGFTRAQFVEIPLSNLLRDRKTEFLKMIRDEAELKEDWAGFLESLNDLSVRVSFRLRVLPHVESMSLAFEPTEDKKALLQFEGTMKAKPEIQILEISGLEILEVDPETGRGNSVAMPASQSNLTAPTSLSFDRTSDFNLEGQLEENFATNDSKKIFKLDLRKWQSSFKDVLLSESDSQRLIDEFLKEERFYAFVQTLMRTRTFGDLMGNDDDPNTSLIEREIMAQLDARREKVIVWMEKGPQGELIPHLHADEPKIKERIERARSEKRLVFEAEAAVPLSLESVKVKVDFDRKVASATLEPHAEFEATFDVKTFELPPDWMGSVQDPLLKKIISQLYGKNLFHGKDVQAHVRLQTRDFKDDVWLPSKGGYLEVPLQFKDGVPHIDSSQVQVELPFLDDVRIRELALKWNGASAVVLQPQSTEPLERQLLRQLDKLVEAHSFVLGDEFIQGMQTAVLTEVERQVEQIQGTRKARFTEDLQYSYSVTGFNIGSEGSAQCKVVQSKGPRSPVGYRFVPFNTGFDILKSPSLMDFDCELQLPKSIDLSLTGIKSQEGDVARIDFSLVAQKPELQKVKIKMKLVRDPQAGFLVMVPETWNLDEVLKNYEIPKNGPGTPAIVGVSAHGLKGVISTSAKIPHLAWSWYLSRKVNLGLLGNTLTSAATMTLAATAYSAEQEAVDQMLREAVTEAIQGIQRDLPETIFTKLNGDLPKRRKLLEQEQLSDEAWAAIARNPFQTKYLDLVDPATVDRGVMGDAEARVLERLKIFQEQTPWSSPIGPFAIDQSGETARQLIESEVRREAVDTIEGTGGIRPVSEIVSNPRLNEIATKARTEGLDYVRRSVSESAEPLERAVIDFLREPSVPDDPNASEESPRQSPLETLELVLSERLMEAATRRSSIQSEEITLPDFCGASLIPSVGEDGQELLTMIVDMEGREKRPALGAKRSERAPDFKKLFEMADEEGAIPVTVSTYLLERIAKNPQNLERVTKLIRDEAVRQPGIRQEDFKLELRDPKVRMTEEGQLVMRIGVKVEQEASTFQTITGVLGLLPDALLSLITGEDVKTFQDITGLPGWLLDRASSPITDLDGFMELEIPVNLSVGDIVAGRNWDHAGHYLVAWSDPEKVKIKSKDGWNSIFGGLAHDQIKENANKFHRDLQFDKPLTIPGYEDLMTFEVGRDMTGRSKRRTVEGIPSIPERDAGPDGLYRGSVVFKLRPIVNPKYKSWPTITVTNDTKKVEVSQQTE